MADATKNGAKKKRNTGPRQAKPLYLIFEGSEKPNVVGVTKDAMQIVSAMSSGKPVNFIDLTPYLPKPKTRVAAAE